MRPLNQLILYWVGQDVGTFVDDIFFIDELDDGRLLTRPKILPTAAQAILMFSEEQMKRMQELRQSPIVIDDDTVPMIRARNISDNANVG